MNLIDVLKEAPVCDMKHCDDCEHCSSGAFNIDYPKWQKQVLEAVAEMLPKEEVVPVLGDDSKFSDTFEFWNITGRNQAIAEMRKRLLKAEKEALK